MNRILTIVAMLIASECMLVSVVVAGGKPLEYRMLSSVGDEATRSVTGSNATYALLIGNSSYPGLSQKFQLKGPANDIPLMKSALVGHGMNEEHIISLLDADRKSILHSMEKMTEQLGKGELAFVYFSGHGEFTTNNNSEYAYLPSDVTNWDDEITVPENAITGTEIYRWVMRMRNRGAFVVLLLDTVGAGGMSMISNHRESAWRLEYGGKPQDGIALNTDAGGFAAFYACKSDEASPEIRLPFGDTHRVAHGLFSYTIAEILQASNTLSYHQVAKEIIKTYEQNYFSSHPVFEFSEPDAMFLDKPARARSGVESAITIAVKPLSMASEEYRGMVSLIADQAMVEISGEIKNAAGLIRVSVNRTAATFNEYGMFTVRIPVLPGDNSVDVIATYRDNTMVPAHFQVPFQPEHAVKEGKNYALMIGIKDYQGPSWPDLTTPIGDMQALRDLLTSHYGFQTRIKQKDGSMLNLVMENPGKNEILETLYRLKDILKTEDQLLIFYAGHGYQFGKRGFWVPSDVSGTRTYKMVSSTEITDALAQMAARHVLIISDSCYSGSLASRAHREMPVSDNTVRNRWIQQLEQSKSRRVLSSGTDEPVRDEGGNGHSVFAMALLHELANPLYDQFVMLDLFNNIQQQTSGDKDSSQQPQFYPITASGHQKGALIFTRKN